MIATLLKSRSKPSLIDQEQVERARQYIEDYWKKLERFHPKDDNTLIGLPNKYLVPSFDPNSPFSYNEQYYWDSYFMVQGMLDAKHKDLVAGILDNLIFMQERFHVIPNASRMYHTSRSQPPLLTSFIFDVYEIGGFTKAWLKKRIAAAKDEYQNVWMNEAHPYWHQVYRGLSRYYDVNVLHNLAEAESGWDMTTRFNRKCLNYLPVDLNAMLYKYEIDFAKAAHILGHPEQATLWLARADQRKKVMRELMWDSRRHLYYDYNFKKQQIGRVSSLAAYFTMWAGIATPEQARHMVKNMKRFEHPGGLATTDTALTALRMDVPTQWAYPNGWAPLHFIVVEGLKRYGYVNEAERIAHKWIAANLAWFNKRGNFIEKYNVVNPYREPVEGVYPSQEGFGWTNAVFERFCQDYL